MIRLPSFLLDLSVGRKLAVFGIAAALPAFAMVALSVWSNAGIARAAERARAATEKYERSTIISAQLGRIQVSQMRLLEYAARAIAASFVSDAEDAFSPDFEAQADELERLVASVPELVREEAVFSFRPERTAFNFYLSQNLMEEGRRYRVLLENDLRAALREKDGSGRLRLLDVDRQLRQSSEMMQRIVDDLSENLMTEVRRLSRERSAALSLLSAQSDRILLMVLLFGCASLIGGVALFRVVERSLARPLRSAVRFVKDVERGERPGSLATRRADEIGVLCAALDRMALEIDRKTGALLEAKETLEERVLERTEHLETALADLSAAQERLIIQGKLAAIGRLSAAMAHDLNTPLGAIVSANNSLIEALGPGLRGITAVIASCSKEEMDWLLRLSELANRRPPRRLARAERKALAAECSRLGWPEAELWAELFADIGLAGPAELGTLPCAPDRALELMKTLELMAAPRKLALLIAGASERAAHVVSDLQQYLRSEESEPPEAFPLRPELLGALDLFAERAAADVETIFDCPEDLVVYGSRRKLAQVWMNLISNALQAMDYRGTLRVGAERDGDFVRVSIADSGVGIPREIGDRIFEPFFTTKKTGDGMGLGLDICRSITRKNGGDISFESEPGNTVFRVIVPAV